MLTVRSLSEASREDRSNVLRVFMDSPAYSELVEGRPPSAEDLDDFFQGKPPTKNADDKSVFGFYVGSEMVGCADVIRAYPTSESAWIGLLLFSEQHQGRGYGKSALALIESQARDWGHSKVQLAAVSTNTRAIAFWQREGFKETRRAENERFTGDLIVMERIVS